MAYAQVPQSDALASPPPDHTDHASLGFARAALTFSHRLDNVRQKRASQNTTTTAASTPSTPGFDLKPGAVASATEVAVGPPTPTPTPTPGATPDAATERVDRTIRTLRVVQNTITALLSLSIALFQGRAYLSFVESQDVKGAWPATPFLAPTLMLLAVAVAALVFDMALLVAYLFPRGRVAGYAVNVAAKAHWLITSAKTISYLLTAVVCRSGFDFGNATATNNDLWSWTCSAKADAFASVNQAESNCTIQGLAWYFSIANVAIEVLGFIINKLVERKATLQKREAVAVDDEDQYSKLEKMRVDVTGEMAQYTPQPTPS